MHKHTPGPWEVESGMVQTVKGHDCKIPGCGVHIPIAYMDRKPGNGTTPCERDANACLIAAAPELLDALKALIPNKAVSDVGILLNAKYVNWDFVKTAIAKAEGRK